MTRPFKDGGAIFTCCCISVGINNIHNHMLLPFGVHQQQIKKMQDLSVRYLMCIYSSHPSVDGPILFIIQSRMMMEINKIRFMPWKFQLRGTNENKQKQNWRNGSSNYNCFQNTTSHKNHFRQLSAFCTFCLYL